MQNTTFITAWWPHRMKTSEKELEFTAKNKLMETQNTADQRSVNKTSKDNFANPRLELVIYKVG